VRHCGQRLGDVVLRQSLQDAVLLGLTRRLLELVVEEVVALLERLQIG
jgi:hypothetical protein